MIPAPSDSFAHRHNSITDSDLKTMLAAIGSSSLDALIDATLPPAIKRPAPTQIPPAATENEALAELHDLSTQNQSFQNYIGAGYHPSHCPHVITRTIFQNPAWYTAYTPYQPEISQGRLEALLNFQTIIADLTGLPFANASMLDEGTAAAEAMTMAHRLRANPDANTFLVSRHLHPQTIEVLQTRAAPLGINILVADHNTFAPDAGTFAAILQYPDTFGNIHDFSQLIQQLHAQKSLVILATDLIALALLKSPGELDADIAVGSTQRLGLPLGFGGPHAAFLSTKDQYKRQMPGRLVGISKDTTGAPALRLALGTREQHIRREKATSNICTAQVLPAIIASMFAVYHGPEGIRNIAVRIKTLTDTLAVALQKLGATTNTHPTFDTLTIGNIAAARVHAAAEAKKINLRPLTETSVAISLNETTTEADLQTLVHLFNETPPPGTSTLVEKPFPENLARKTTFLAAPVFNQYHTEHELLRYIKHLESKDLSLCHSMIPLGSCTMKLTATAAMVPLTWPQLANIHPHAPATQTRGYAKILRQLETWLADLTGFSSVSLQPNSGANGEYAGILTIRNYLHSIGQSRRNIVLIPNSAHGTNPASAVMAGYSTDHVACDKNGNIDLDSLRQKIAQHQDTLAAIMITYPSTHGVFEETIREICQLIHAAGAQVYMDGANMNAQVGLTSPGHIGADVCHLNLHKTFSSPHGGGGPGLGPIGVAKHLAPHIPKHVASTAYGSALINVIPWMYIRMMGAGALTHATKLAILNANYIAARLQTAYPVLYRNHNNLNAHEVIIDLRQWKSAGIEVDDVAKRLMDYGYHAPTMSFPVPGTLMIEPTESETLSELDRFIDSLLSIRQEIEQVLTNQIDKLNNPLKNAPHPAHIVSADNWPHPYTRQQAAYPTQHQLARKFWPSTTRIDNVYGDRNLSCSCQ